MQFIGLSIGGMLGQAFAIEHGQRLISAMLCDTSPQTPPGAQEAWAPRIDAVKKANSLAPLADPTMERWFTDAYKPRNPGRWKQIHATIAGTTPAGYLGCAAAILHVRFGPAAAGSDDVAGPQDERDNTVGGRRQADGPLPTVGVDGSFCGVPLSFGVGCGDRPRAHAARSATEGTVDGVGAAIVSPRAGGGEPDPQVAHRGQCEREAVDGPVALGRV